MKWAVSEMERRYQIMSEMGVRNIQGFNKKLKDTEERGERLYRPGVKRRYAASRETPVYRYYRR